VTLRGITGVHIAKPIGDVLADEICYSSLATGSARHPREDHLRLWIGLAIPSAPAESKIIFP